MLLLPLAATQPGSPTYNATPATTEGCRATGVSHDLFASPALNMAKGPASGRMKGAGDFSLSQRLWAKALALLLTDGTDHRGSKNSESLLGIPPFLRAGFYVADFFFYLKDTKRYPEKWTSFSVKTKAAVSQA